MGLTLEQAFKEAWENETIDQKIDFLLAQINDIRYKLEFEMRNSKTAPMQGVFTTSNGVPIRFFERERMREWNNVRFAGLQKI